MHEGKWTPPKGTIIDIITSMCKVKRAQRENNQDEVAAVKVFGLYLNFYLGSQFPYPIYTLLAISLAALNENYHEFSILKCQLL